MKLLTYFLLSTSLFCEQSKVNAYNVLKWETIEEKTPVTLQTFKDLRQFYELIFSLGLSALSKEDLIDSLDIENKFGLKIKDKTQNQGYKALIEFQKELDESKEMTIDNQAEMEDFRYLMDIFERELALLDSSLLFAQKYAQISDPKRGEDLQRARKEFHEYERSFTKEKMWAVRSFNRVWKKQGMPAKAYIILENKLMDLL